MVTLKTLSLGRDETRARLLSAVRHLSRDLASFSETSNGAFYLFGSFLRGDFSDVSDVDVMVGFPEPSRADAMDFAETACLRYGLKPDVRPAPWVSTPFRGPGKAIGAKASTSARWHDVGDELGTGIAHLENACRLSDAFGMDGEALRAYANHLIPVTDVSGRVRRDRSRRCVTRRSGQRAARSASTAAFPVSNRPTAAF